MIKIYVFHALGFILASLCSSALAFADTITTETHRFEEVAEGVYFAVGTGAVDVWSNSLVIVNDDHVVVVDSHITEDAARTLIAGIESFTDKPIRYLINSHYHFDHAHGNRAFGDVEIIGHEFTRQMLLGNVLEQDTYVSFTAGAPEQIDAMKKEAADLRGDAKEKLEHRIAIKERHWKALGETKPIPPTLTMKQSMTLFKGGREIQLHHLGRGHTGGDVVIFLPAERIVFTGDLLLPFLSYMGDGYVEDWDETLENLKSLEFDVILPGHGQPIRDRSHIDHIQSFLSDLWDKVAAMKRAGMTPQEVAESIDLTNHGDNLPQLRRKGIDVRAVIRMYQLMEK